MKRITRLVVAILVCAAPRAQAEKVDTPKAGLQKMATHIVFGEVRAVYERHENAGRYAYTHYVAEIKAEKVEKGEGIAAGGLVYVRYWRRRWIGAGKPPPGTAGHRGLPEKGEKLRVYLARNVYDGFTKDNTDGGYNVIGANGFER